MLIGSKEHARELAKSLIFIRRYEKTKGTKSYISWAKGYRLHKRLIQSLARNMAKQVDEAILNEI